MKVAYYNEIDRYAAQWLRNLIDAGHIARGDVDERSIVDVSADDLAGYSQCHFFAGIGGWSYALRLAGWPDTRPAWTGSCPCQPFSAAGKGGGGKDERHLWPHWFRLIRERKPAIVFGENVAAAVGWGWLDAVLGDLEAEGYATGSAVLGAHSVGAPHIRQRLWFVAHHDGGGHLATVNAGEHRPRGGEAQPAGRLPSGLVADAATSGRRARLAHDDAPRDELHVTGRGNAGLVADADAAGKRLERGGGLLDGERAAFRDDADGRGAGELGDSSPPGLEGHAGDGDDRRQPGRQRAHAAGPVAAADPHGFWDDLVWLPCSDGKARPTQSGLFPLAHGVSGRVGKLRAAGNAIVAQCAAEFIRACMP